LSIVVISVFLMATTPTTAPHSYTLISMSSAAISSQAAAVPVDSAGADRNLDLTNNEELETLRDRLAKEVGFSGAQPAQAFLAMYENRCSQDRQKDYLDLFLRTVQYFSQACEEQKTLGSWIDKLVAKDEPLFRRPVDMRRNLIIDQVFCILGSWTSMISYFMRSPRGYRPIVYAYATSQNLQQSWEHCTNAALGETLPDLICKSQLLNFNATEGLPLMRGMSNCSTISGIRSAFGLQQDNERDDLSVTSRTPLLFHTVFDYLESAQIPANILNAHTLRILAGVQIQWTTNISRHLLLSSSGGCKVLEVYALPSLFRFCTASLKKAGIPEKLKLEVLESYPLLFNPRDDANPHGGRFGAWRRWWCWCVSCSSRRVRVHELARLSGQISTLKTPQHAGLITKNEYDSYLKIIMVTAHRGQWDSEFFRLLWPRITLVDEHLKKSRPWNFWVLFRDRRESLPFWTFFFATFVVVLTVVQVGLGIAQVVGSFGGG
jgi:hypothetical protein